MTFAVTDKGNKRTILRSERMEDKTFERAKQIKDELYRLKSLKRNIEKSNHIGLDLCCLEVIRKPFVDTVQKVMEQLENEYKDL